ncbi:YlqD family protein|uniref:YlqD protein n=1 Tax=Dendrosporobacter quercicolus TaxID=146817 RepID=A0A1G9L9Y2_9FIRM|nr:YlqD family protein [Dendrosporobacter quercicolus]NSL46648.1 YlqD family protein [Dendrosporobacter quercicolus DSM 1736]SDL58771.1 YlqD protein [Dendrosporobacter quercicolus]
METITLKCPVTIKAKVTDDLKKHLAAEIQENIKKADLELQQIEFHAKRLMAEQARQDAQGLIAVRQQIDGEKQKRIDFKNHLLDKLKETAQLELGSEIVQGTLDRIVELKVGDDLPKLMNAEILLEDGKVLAFRN